MKRMPLSRLFALPLALTLLLSPAAQALTPDQARELLQDYYIDEVPEDVLDQNTIQAMLEALGDPYTTYFSPEEYGAFTGSMSDTDTVGVGIYSLVTADGPLIQRVYENTPAADAGLQPGDLVTAVDGRSTAGQDAGTVAAWLKGDPGTRVELSYRRDGAEYTAVLTRRAITVPATYTELWDGHIGYIDCDTFGGETVAHFVSGMEDTAAGADHWIVDLRGNGGGEVDAAMGAAGCFTGSGVLAYLKDSTGAYGAYGSNDDARTLSPVIVLTDGETASASELFASDIRDTNTGILVGGRTFGKGVAQTVLDQRALPDYFPDGDAIKITSYRFYAPSGSTTDTVGLIPHLLVDPDLAPEVATLLSASSPKGSTEGYLRIDFNWRWYVELDTALSEAHRDAFTALLEALPDGVRVLEGTGGPDGWADTTVEELVGRYVLTSYRDRSFTDTAGSPYAAQIDRLATYGILAGTGGGAFQPEGSLTRAQLCALPAGKAHILNRTGINAIVLFKAVRQHLGAYRNVELFSLGAEVSKVLQGVLIVGRARITHAQHGIGAYAHRILGGVQQAKGIHRFAECRNSSVRTHYNTGIAEIILKGLNNTIGSQKSVSTTCHSLADNMSRILQIGRRHHCCVIHSQHEGLAVLFKEIIHSAFHNSFFLSY